MKKAQKVLDEDKTALGRIGEHYTKLTRLAQEIRHEDPQLGKLKEILCSLFIAGNKLQKSTEFSEATVVSFVRVFTAAKQSGEIVEFDIYKIDQVSMDINKESKSAAAESLRKITEGFRKEVEGMDEFLGKLRYID